MKLLQYFLIYITTILFLLFSHSIFAQHRTMIPSERVVEWDNVGYNRGNGLPTLNGTPEVIVSGKDSISVKTALNSAKILSQNGLVIVKFGVGDYYTNEQIILTNNMILQGEGSRFNDDSPFINSTQLIYTGPDDLNKSCTVIKIQGEVISNALPINNWAAKQITLENPASSINVGDYLLYYARSTDGDQKIGNIIKVTQKNSNTSFDLEDDISLTNQLAVLSTAGVYLIEPVQNVGIQDMTIRSLNPTCNNTGHNIEIRYAVNCWIKGVESYKPFNAHVGISSSSAIEIRECYFQQSHSYGAGGVGYGVSLGNYTNNCLIEDNIFRYLRHSMIVSTGANRNVFAYNYSREQNDEYNYNVGDISIHGRYPYANLFEGNIVNRIQADMYWGSNGPFNTFFRNYCTEDEIKIEQEWNSSKPDPDCDYAEGDNNYNILGNESKLVTVKIENINGENTVVPMSTHNDVLDHYGKYRWSPYSTLSHKTYSRNSDLNHYLLDDSYFRNSKPSFMDSNISWPPIGPSSSNINFQITEQEIPARIAFYNNYYGITPPSLSKRNLNSNDDIENNTIKEFNLFQNYPNPFNPTTKIEFSIPSDNNVEVKVFNTLGMEVTTLLNGNKVAGTHSVEFNASNLSSGIYFYKIVSGNYTDIKKMILLR
jgi:Secretion system C-terminal sorting domain